MSPVSRVGLILSHWEMNHSLAESPSLICTCLCWQHPPGLPQLVGGLRERSSRTACVGCIPWLVEPEWQLLSVWTSALSAVKGQVSIFSKKDWSSVQTITFHCLLNNKAFIDPSRCCNATSGIRLACHASSYSPLRPNLMSSINQKYITYRNAARGGPSHGRIGSA